MSRRLPVLLAAAALASLGAYGCGGEEEERAVTEGIAGTTAGSDETTTSGSHETTTSAEKKKRKKHKGAKMADPAAGKTVFLAAGCGNCHTLAAAGTRGTTGPNLDEHFGEDGHHEDAFAEIVRQVRNGGGGMPAFRDRLTRKQIRDVAAFVDEATKR